MADSHVGVGFPNRFSPNRSTRGHDLVASHRRAVAAAIQKSADLVLHAGDLFNAPDPGPAILQAAIDPLLEVASAGCPVFVIPGNHERGVLPGSLFLSHPNIHVFDRPRTVSMRLRGLRVAVTGIPACAKPAHASFLDALQASNWQAAHADLRLLICHEAFAGAQVGPVGFRFRPGEDVLRTDQIPESFAYVAAGHVHRHQILKQPGWGGPCIAYSGSPDRISFAERDEQKGVVVVDFHGPMPQPEFIPYAVRPMSVHPIDLTGLSPEQILERLHQVTEALPESAMAELRLSGETTPDALRGVRWRARAQNLRPDADVRLSMQSIRFVPNRCAQAGVAGGLCAAGALFSGIEAEAKAVHEFTIEQISSVPNRSGTYGLLDGGGRLLYVGKASQLRARLQQHLRGDNDADFFDGWTRQVRRIAIRTSESPFEAALVEADLVTRLRPPFNRQMRGWERGCYLVDTGAPFGQLAIATDPVPGARHFGPFGGRTSSEYLLEALNSYFGVAQCPGPEMQRVLPLVSGSAAGLLCDRYFARQCTGPCAARIEAQAYAERLRQRSDFLEGAACPDEILESESMDSGLTTGQGAILDHRSKELLSLTYDRAAWLARARTLVGRELWLPGQGPWRTVMEIDRRGVQFRRRQAPQDADAAGVRLEPGGTASLPGGEALPKALVDLLLLAARHVWARRTKSPQEMAEGPGPG